MEFDSSGRYNGKLLDVPLHRVFPEKITGQVPCALQHPLFCRCTTAPHLIHAVSRAVLEADALGRLPQRTRGVLEFVIDDLGHRSAKAQGLGAVITTVRKMLYTDQRLYIHRSDREINGMLKVGRKNLFIRDYATGKMNEINPLCVLDFYVHESVQRGGIGKQLFEEMLRRERADPASFGYDRPSPKLIGFLRKHYGLVDFDPQPNNFVVFKAYFTKAATARVAQNRQPSSGRRAPDLCSELSVSGCSGTDGKSGWQSANRGSSAGASNSFFLGGSGMPEHHRNSQNRALQPNEASYADGGLPPRDPQVRRLHDAEDRSARSRSPQDLPIAHRAQNGVGNSGWSSKLGALAQEDSLAEFARTRQGTGDSQRGHAGASGVREGDPVRGLRDGVSVGGRDKSLQEEASHCIYGARRPASGRRAFAPLPPGPHNPTGLGREQREAGAEGLGTKGGAGGSCSGAMGAANPWRTANSEIGGWNRQKVADADAHYLGQSHRNSGWNAAASSTIERGAIANFAAQRGYAGGGGGGEGGLARAALQDRRVGNRLW